MSTQITREGTGLVKVKEIISRPPLCDVGLYDQTLRRPRPRMIPVPPPDDSAGSDGADVGTSSPEERDLSRNANLAVGLGDAQAALEAWSKSAPRRKPGR